jgi:hypothetical protein
VSGKSLPPIVLRVLVNKHGGCQGYQVLELVVDAESGVRVKWGAAQRADRVPVLYTSEAAEATVVTWGGGAGRRKEGRECSRSLQPDTLLPYLLTHNNDSNKRR